MGSTSGAVVDGGSGLNGAFAAVGRASCALTTATPARMTGTFGGVGLAGARLRAGAAVAGRFVGAGLIGARLTPYAKITGAFAGIGGMLLGMARRPARINCACVFQHPGLPALALVGRTDANVVSIVDLLTAGQTVLGMRYVTRPMISNLPFHQRGTIGEQEPRAARKRVPRVKVYGEGSLAAGSTITLHVDGKSEMYPCQGTDATTDILIMQGFSPNMIGRVFSVELNLSGSGVVVRDVEMDYVFVG